jgi:predicted O-methyltransferase YrrM
MEHFYKNINSETWFNYEEFYSLIVSKFPTNSHFVEVGVWKGMSACFMAVEIINSGKNIKFDCVDTWEYVSTSKELDEDKFENLYNIFLDNIKPVEDKINIVKGTSWEAASNYEDNSLDFVFIDAGHDYESVKKDLTAWNPKVKSSGIISGHDYHFDCGVFPAVNEFFGKENISVIKSCWMYDKSK